MRIIILEYNLNQLNKISMITIKKLKINNKKVS